MNADEKEKGWYGGCKDPLFWKKATQKCCWRPGELMGGWQERRRGEISMKQINVFCSKIIPGASLLLALVSICECLSHTKYFVSWNTSLTVYRLCVCLNVSPISEFVGGWVKAEGDSPITGSIYCLLLGVYLKSDTNFHYISLFPSTFFRSPQFSSVQLLSHVQLFVTPWIPARQASLSIIISQSPPKPMSIESVMPSSDVISSSVVPVSSCLQSLPASGSFPMSQLFVWGVQSVGVSASTSVLPMNTQDWSPLGWTGWISLPSKGLSRVFSNTTVQTHQFFGAQLSLYSNSHIHTWPLAKP